MSKVSAHKNNRFELTPASNNALLTLCGEFNKNIDFIAKEMTTEIVHRGFHFKIAGQGSHVQKTQHVIENLYEQILDENLNFLDNERIHLQICSSSKIDTSRHNAKYNSSHRPRNKNQIAYLDTIDAATITFGLGPAGTGKTFLAVMAALRAFHAQEIDRLILMRPAVDAGEKLGFLPGDASQKVDPYLRPLYDSLFAQLGVEQTTAWIEKSRIEIAPLAFIRGRTFNRSFIILDEGQNATDAQIRMLLTRLGFGSKMVITGDLSQTDLPRDSMSGLSKAVNVLKDINGLSVFRFEQGDIVRHPIVKEIVNLYERSDEQ